jgi:hypothetical protein
MNLHSRDKGRRGASGLGIKKAMAFSAAAFSRCSLLRCSLLRCKPEPAK